MIKTLTEHGNSLALVIDKPILDLLNITRETPLKVTTDGHSLLISPEQSAAHKKILRSSLTAVNRKHGAALRKLAE